MSKEGQHGLNESIQLQKGEIKLQAEHQEAKSTVRGEPDVETLDADSKNVFSKDVTERTNEQAIKRQTLKSMHEQSLPILAKAFKLLPQTSDRTGTILNRSSQPEAVKAANASKRIKVDVEIKD